MASDTPVDVARASSTAAEPRLREVSGTQQRFWPGGWWRMIDTKIGIIPVPVYLVLAALIAILVVEHEIKSDGPTMIAVLVMGGFTCAEIGKRIPILKNIGAGAIFATFIPSALVYYKLVPTQVLTSVTEFTKSTNFLYIYIASIIVGSILGMDRSVLIKGFLKIFIPLGLGSILAGLVGTLIGTALGIGSYKTFFFIVVPIMAGGIGEGAIPLTIGYAAILSQQQGVLFAQVLPPVMLGSLTAIVFAGALNFIGKKYPHLTGEGKLQPDQDGMTSSDAVAKAESAKGQIDPATLGAAGLVAVTLYLLGVMAHHIIGLPAPVAMLFMAVVAKLASAVSPQLQAGGFVVYKFVQVTMTYPLLFAIGAALTPWSELIAAFTLVNIITIVSTVATIMATGWFVGRWLGMYPIETAIVNACHSGQGGTGDVAILTAANRMALMPFAQIATRIGGALTVTGVLIVMRWIGA